MIILDHMRALAMEEARGQRELECFDETIKMVLVNYKWNFCLEFHHLELNLKHFLSVSHPHKSNL